MPARSPLHVWICVSLFVLSVGTVPLVRRALHGSASSPQTLAELTQLISQDAPSLHVVSVVEGQPESGIYISTQPQPREQLFRLRRGSEIACKCKWQGVVLCERDRNVCGVIEEHILQGWGEYTMRIGPLLFFGDPLLLERLHKLTFDPRGK